MNIFSNIITWHVFIIGIMVNNSSAAFPGDDDESVTNDG